MPKITEPYLLGFNHETTSIAERERLQELLPAFYADLNNRYPGDSLQIITCNRLELLSVQNLELENVLQSVKNELNLKQQNYYFLKGMDACRHVMKVAASLDSAIIGESQILGQVKQSYAKAVQASRLNSVLHRLLQYSFSTAKRVRSTTNLSVSPTSYGRIALSFAEEIYSDLSAQSLLLLGAGQMSELAAVYFQSRGLKNITVVSRTFSKAAELAKKLQCKSGNLIDLDQLASEHDIIIGALDLANPIISKKNKITRQAKLFLDLGVPRNFANDLQEIEDYYLYDMSDFISLAKKTQVLRESAKEAALPLIDYSVARYYDWLERYSNRERIIQARKIIFDVCSTELEKLIPGEVDSRSLVKSLAAKVAHEIIHSMNGQDLFDVISNPEQIRNIVDIRKYVGNN